MAGSSGPHGKGGSGQIFFVTQQLELVVHRLRCVVIVEMDRKHVHRFTELLLSLTQPARSPFQGSRQVVVAELDRAERDLPDPIAMIAGAGQPASQSRLIEVQGFRVFSHRPSIASPRPEVEPPRPRSNRPGSTARLAGAGRS
ncbi:hypothetical protein AD017_31740 (plasmid) [Pseudonocardia sp. EC080619-01]|nr:hypothetical protein AD017_31740 [Pseudonocardia sp. EC080619-01]